MNPADNPAEVERTRENGSDDDTKTMNGEDNPTDDSNVAKNTEGTEWDLTAMSAAPTGHNQYRVLSTRNNTVTHYHVNLLDGECSCPSEKYNLSENEACPHLAKAVLVDAQRDEEARISTDLSYLNDRAKNLMYDLRDTVDFAKTLAENNARDYGGDDSVPSQTDAGNDDAGSPSESGVDVVGKMGELQSAYDDVIDDMQTDANGGLIWIQTGKDTPETLPGPGSVDVFEAFLKNPSQVEFIHDDHPRASDRPGQWWKNAIKPSQVDSYINEVLK